ncbi:MAG: hypothetical protein CMO55_24425 [Verrucomicrobiales bacterium]|nr:hypothetical protein [Verrucomicrobiales bacterium]
MKTFSSLFLSTTLIFSAAVAHSQGIGHSGAGWRITGTDPIEIYYGDQHVTSYNAGVEEGKPFFYPLIGPTGENMTRHWPMKEGFDDEATDHIHHRGMWYGLGKVNGLDFWHFHGDDSKKDKTFGIIRHKGMNGVQMSSDDIIFKTKSEWLSYDDQEKRIMSDRREFEISYREDGALVIDTKITLIADAGDVTIHDDKEGAWSIRTIPTLRLEGDHAKGNIVNSDDIEGKEAWGKRAKWVDYYGTDRAGNPVGIAIFDNPENPRYPTWWHARHYGLFTANPFGQGHFEKETPEDAGNFTIKNGEEVTFQYRTIFHKGTPEEASIAESFKEYSGE